jgi:hypothetical protein
VTKRCNTTKNNLKQKMHEKNDRKVNENFMKQNKKMSTEMCRRNIRQLTDNKRNFVHPITQTIHLVENAGGGNNKAPSLTVFHFETEPEK